MIVYTGYGFEAYELDLIPDGSLGSRCDLYEIVVDLCICMPCIGRVVLQFGVDVSELFVEFPSEFEVSP